MTHTCFAHVNIEEWKYPPFKGIIDENNVLHGRGAVDMKGGMASFVVALEDFIAKNPHHSDSIIGVILTSDEEGNAEYGTKIVFEELTHRGITIDMGIVGEPTSSHTLGDTIKLGRRGSLGGELTIIGIQGHVAYPHLSLNPIHESLGALKELLVDEKWDDGQGDFGPTTFQILNMNAGTGKRSYAAVYDICNDYGHEAHLSSSFTISGANNVVPGFKKVVFNFR